MIRLIIKYFNFILEFFLKEKTLINIKKKENLKKIFIFDLDNTLVNTWEGYNQNNGEPNYFSFFSIYRKANAYPEMAKFINSINTNENVVIFLTARNSLFYRTTKIWLESKLSIDNYNLILVNSASRKIGILDTLSKMGSVNYYDDLTYGHEFGEIIFYEKIITQVKALPICYFDFEYISKFNSTK